MFSVALSRGRIGHVRRFLIVGLAAVLLMAVTATIPGAPLGAHRADAAPPTSDPGVVANPPIGAACGIDVVFTFDGSNSINSTEGGQMISAAQSFVDVLEGSPSHVAATYFRGISAAGGNGVGGLVPNAGWTDISSSANATAFNTALGSFSPWSGPNDQGGTNWEDGFNTADPLLPRPDTKPDLILFMTDGNPTTYNGSNDLGTNSGTDDLWSGMREANQHKSEGTRVVGIGIGDGLSSANIAKISGPTQGSDYFLAADFGDLEDILVDIALSACTSSVTVHKYVDGALSNGWDFSASPQLLTGTTGDNGPGTVTFAFNPQPNASVSTTITETLEDGHLFDDASCTLDGQPIGSPESLGVSLTIGFLDHVQCVFNNSAPDPDIELVKTGTLVDGGDGVDVGDTITYAFTVKNTGNVTLTNVTIADTVGGVTVTGTAIPTLAPNASNNTAYTGTYTLTQADVDAGTFTNTATATGTPPNGPDVTDPDDDTQTFDSDPDIMLAKSGTFEDESGDGLAQAGETISYAFIVANTGNVTLTNVTIADTVGGVTVTGSPIALLPVGAFDDSTYTGTYTLTQADVDAGTFTNTATATGTPPNGPDVTDPDDDTQTFDSDPDIMLAKSGTFEDESGDGLAQAGETISYTFTVTNTGGVTLTNVTVTDTVGGVTVTGTAIPTLAPNASNNTAYTGTYTLTQADVDAGTFTNTAEACGLDSAEAEVCDEDDHEEPLPQTTGLVIEKLTNGEDADTATGPLVRAGDLVTWSYAVSNTGNVSLFEVTVSDDVSGVNPGYVSGDDGNGVLDPGEMWIYEATGAATAGQYVNVGTVEALDPTEESLTATDPSHHFGVEASIDLVKTGAFGLGDDGIANPGDVISYEFEVTNTGNVDLTSIDVEDLDLGGIAVACPNTGLAVGESMTCTAAYPVSQEDINEGSVDNCAVASGVDPIEDAVSDEDCFETVVGQLPSISVIKVAEPEIIPIGSESVVTWTIDVTNTGNVPLVDVAIADPLVPSCEANIGGLDIGETTTHTCTSTHTPDSLSWTFTNIAVATGIGPDGTEVTDDDEATLLPIQVLGTAQIGDTVWQDTNKNGVQDSGEAGINGAKVTLKDAAGTVIATATTAKGPWDGWYKFVGLDAGRYTITLDTSSVSGSLTTAGSFTIDLADGVEYLDADFGVADALPKTGADAEMLMAMALLLLGLGAVLIRSTRLRSDDK